MRVIRLVVDVVLCSCPSTDHWLNVSTWALCLQCMYIVRFGVNCAQFSIGSRHTPFVSAFGMSICKSGNSVGKAGRRGMQAGRATFCM